MAKLEPYWAVEGMENLSMTRPRFHDKPTCLFAAKLCGYDVQLYNETRVTAKIEALKPHCAACGKPLKNKPKGVEP